MNYVKKIIYHWKRDNNLSCYWYCNFDWQFDYAPKTHARPSLVSGALRSWSQQVPSGYHWRILNMMKTKISVFQLNLNLDYDEVSDFSSGKDFNDKDNI